MDAGWEEYYDYIFPEDEAAQPNLKLLAMAKTWKNKTEDDSDSDGTSDSEEEDESEEEPDSTEDPPTVTEENSHDTATDDIPTTSQTAD